MIKVVLIGDQANAQQFIHGLEEYRQPGHHSHYRLNNIDLDLRYQAKPQEVVPQRFSAIVVINTLNGKIPESVNAVLAKLPVDHVYYYRNANVNSAAFMQSFVRRLREVETKFSKLFSLFSRPVEDTSKRHLHMGRTYGVAEETEEPVVLDEPTPSAP